MSPWDTGKNLREINYVILIVGGVEIFSHSMCEFS